MSNIALTVVATVYAERQYANLYNELVNPDLTSLGRVEAIKQALMLAVMYGFNLAERANELSDKLKKEEI